VLVADLHTHTVASGHAFGTLWENARIAKEKGLRVIAVTDHGPSLPRAPGPYHFTNLRVVPRYVEGVRILRSVEANIVNEEGDLDLPEDILARLDLVVAGLHVNTGIDGRESEWNTRALVGAIAKPFLDVVAHPGVEFPADPHAIVEAATEHRKAIEINESYVARPKNIEPCTLIARLCAQKGTFVAVSSDAHSPFSVGEVGRAWELARKCGVRPEQVINFSLENLGRFFKERGRTWPWPDESGK